MTGCAFCEIAAARSPVRSFHEKRTRARQDRKRATVLLVSTATRRRKGERSTLTSAKMIADDRRLSSPL